MYIYIYIYAHYCVALRMMRPSLMSFLTLKRELAMEISLTSLGSSQMRPRPHFLTEAARRFWSFMDPMAATASWHSLHENNAAWGTGGIYIYIYIYIYVYMYMYRERERYNVIYYTILYYTIPYHTIPYHTILYYGRVMSWLWQRCQHLLMPWIVILSTVPPVWFSCDRCSQ